MPTGGGRSPEPPARSEVSTKRRAVEGIVYSSAARCFLNDVTITGNSRGIDVLRSATRGWMRDVLANFPSVAWLLLDGWCHLACFGILLPGLVIWARLRHFAGERPLPGVMRAGLVARLAMFFAAAALVRRRRRRPRGGFVPVPRAAEHGANRLAAPRPHAQARRDHLRVRAGPGLVELRLDRRGVGVPALRLERPLQPP